MANRYWVAGGTENYNSTTNWSASSGGAAGASVPTTVDDIFFDTNSGVGTVTINVASNCRSINLTGFGGSFVFTNNLTVVGTSLVFNVGSYTVTGAGFLIFANSNNTFSITSNGTTWGGNLRLGNASPTINLVDNLSVAGNLELTSSGVLGINSNNITVGGNLSILGSSVIIGSSTIILNGTGTWSNTGSTALRNNLTINTAGTITIGNVIYNTGILTYTAGTVVTTSSTITIAGNTTLNTNGITWNDITISNVITLLSDLTLIGTLANRSGVTLSFTLSGGNLISINANLTLNSGTFTLPANQTFKTLTTQVGGCTLNGNTLTLTENIVVNQNLVGTTSIVYGGTGTWTAGTSAHVINNNFTINTAGTLTISGIVYKATNTFTYTAGTIVDTGATVVVGNTSSTTCNIAGVTWEKLLIGGIITLTSDINAVTFGTTRGNAISFSLGGNSLNFTDLELGHISNAVTLPTAWVCQNINFSLASSGQINGFSITINGDILQSNNGVMGGTTTFIYGGTGTWSRTGNNYFSNAFTINTSGTLTFSGGNIGGGIFTYTAGTVDVQIGSILYIRVAGTTMNHGSIVWYDVLIGTALNVGIVASLVLNDKLICSNSLTLGTSSTILSGTDGTFDTYDLYFGSQGSSTTTRLVATKTYIVRRLLQCTQAPSTYPLTLNSTVGGTRAILTVSQGTSIDIGYLNITDIDSSLGRKMYSFQGVISNSLNWEQLPVDVKSTSSTFVN